MTGLVVPDPLMSDEEDRLRWDNDRLRQRNLELHRQNQQLLGENVVLRKRLGKRRKPGRKVKQ